jgi:hypothetical protein
MSCNELGFASSTESGSPDVTNFYDQRTRSTKSGKSKRSTSRYSDYRQSIERLYETHVKTIGSGLANPVIMGVAPTKKRRMKTKKVNNTQIKAKINTTHYFTAQSVASALQR